jgi:hypothetical protein
VEGSLERLRKLGFVAWDAIESALKKGLKPASTLLIPLVGFVRAEI